MNIKDGYYVPKISPEMPIAYWPTHLAPNVVKDAFGVRLCGFTISLEAWRRGLTVSVNRFKASSFQSFIITSAEKSLRFNRGRIVDLNSQAAVLTVIDKDATRKALKDAGVPTPLGRKFLAEENYKDACNYANSIGWPVVVKPLSGSLGRGVYTNISSESELLGYCQHLVEVLKVSSYIIEKHVTGEDYRILANTDKVFAAAKRVPANIVGNGVDTIKQLIGVKNVLRKQNPNYYKGLIKIDKEVKYYIEKEGYELDTVLPEGTKLFLRGKANTSAGGDLIDFTDDIPPAMAAASINAIKAIDGLEFGGIDIVFDDVSGEFSIIEINSRPQISHMYPTEGLGRDLPRMIIDTYFPEAPINHDQINPHLIFDVNSVLAPLESNVVSHLTIAPAKRFKNFTRRYYSLSGCEIKSINNLSDSLEALAKKFNVIGTASRVDGDKLVLRLAGSRASVKEYFSEVKDLIAFEKHTEARWTGVVKQRFIVNF